MQRILIVDDDKDLCFLLDRFMTRKGYDVCICYSGQQAIEELERTEPDLLISDLGLGDIDGITLLNKSKEMYPGLPVIIITGFSDIRVSATAMRQGAFDYVMKPLLPEQMLLTVQDALESRKRGIYAANYHFNEKEPKEYFFWGEGDTSKKLLRQVHLVAPTNHNLIICGEDGSGKHAIAHEVHKLSKRSHMPFVTINPEAIAAKNMSVALFGDANGEQTGILDEANGGTLLIADPSTLLPDIQEKFLYFMRQRAWTREGGGLHSEMDIRFVAASRKPLWDAVRSGELLEELYHRLNDFTISIPPLRERKDEIAELANHFLKLYNDSLGTQTKGITPEAMTLLKRYAWHDNVRELKNLVQKAALQCSGNNIGVECLPAEIKHAGTLVPED
jgi:two-component system response regulator HydG